MEEEKLDDFIGIKISKRMKEKWKDESSEIGKDLSAYIKDKVEKDFTIPEEDLNYLKSKLNLISENQEEEIKELKTQVRDLKIFIEKEFKDMGKALGAFLKSNLKTVSTPETQGGTEEELTGIKKIKIPSHEDYDKGNDEIFKVGDTLIFVGGREAEVVRISGFYYITLKYIDKNTNEYVEREYNFKEARYYNLVKEIKRF